MGDVGAADGRVGVNELRSPLSGRVRRTRRPNSQKKAITQCRHEAINFTTYKEPYL